MNKDFIEGFTKTAEAAGVAALLGLPALGLGAEYVMNKAKEDGDKTKARIAGTISGAALGAGASIPMFLTGAMGRNPLISAAGLATLLGGPVAGYLMGDSDE
jgi:hypothetical protein